ncbi:hypothetical protein Sar04_38760 [Salinispora arenicola]|uniref:Ketoreductase domain-containing protein n=2 Tax=Salinispora arenicola TaxID=168697 RepID=A0ABQ4JW23_SALAC|nr:hypothetical protein Sar04_38760 [Salinispora arenicola]
MKVVHERGTDKRRHGVVAERPGDRAVLQRTDMTLRDKAVLVTGAGTGIGRAVAVRAAREGARVALLGRRRELLDQTAALIKGAAPDAPVLACASSLAEPDELDDAVGDVLDAFGRLDGLVNNAGIARFSPVETADPADLQLMFDVHVKGPVHLLRTCLPELRARRGSVVNVTSVGGALATPHRSFYGASKAAINHLTRSLAIELAPEVRVNAVLPGPVDTPIYDDLGLSDEATGKLREDLLARTPMGRFGQSDEVATWVCRLLDDESGWVTGVLLPVDGGRCA